MLPNNWRSPVAGWLWVAPFMVVCLGVLIGPFVAGLHLSLFRANLFGGSVFVGIENYVRLLKDPGFRQAFVNTVLFVIMAVPAMMALALGLALLLNRPTRAAGVVRAVVFSTSLLSVTVVTLIWRQILVPDGGLISTASHAMGLPAPAMLSDRHLVLFSLALVTVWWTVGLPMTLILSALQQVPKRLYEAAELDHAGPLRQLIHVTLPAIAPSLTVIATYECVLQLQIFGQPQLLTGGGPDGASRTLVLYIYDIAFHQWDIGYAAAAAQFLFALILLVAATPSLLQRLRAGAA